MSLCFEITAVSVAEISIEPAAPSFDDTSNVPILMSELDGPAATSLITPP